MSEENKTPPDQSPDEGAGMDREDRRLHEELIGQAKREGNFTRRDMAELLRQIGSRKSDKRQR